jgi:hypothetical protein
MRRTGRTAAVAAAVLVTAVTGCGSDGAAAGAVPPIGNARDARAADPCALPTGAHLTVLGISAPGVAATAAEGRHCEWKTAWKSGSRVSSIHGRPARAMTV